MLALGDIDVRSSSNSVTLLSRLLVPEIAAADVSAGGIYSFGGTGAMGLDLGGEATIGTASVGGGIWGFSFPPGGPATWRPVSPHSGFKRGRGFSLVAPLDRSGSVGFAGRSFESRLSGDE